MTVSSLSPCHINLQFLYILLWQNYFFTELLCAVIKNYLFANFGTNIRLSLNNAKPLQTSRTLRRIFNWFQQRYGVHNFNTSSNLQFFKLLFMIKKFRSFQILFSLSPSYTIVCECMCARECFIRSNYLSSLSNHTIFTPVVTDAFACNRAQNGFNYSLDLKFPLSLFIVLRDCFKGSIMIDRAIIIVNLITSVYLGTCRRRG